MVFFDPPVRCVAVLRAFQLTKVTRVPGGIQKMAVFLDGAV